MPEAGTRMQEDSDMRTYFLDKKGGLCAGTQGLKGRPDQMREGMGSC